jgi:AP-3 complex subunit mu
MIEKHYRGVTPRTVCDVFWDEVGKHAKREEVPPVIFTAKFYLVSVLRDGMFVVASVTSEVSPLLIIEFLHRVVDVFMEYFGAVDEMSIKENFSTCYQLLEEMMDNGYPLTTEPNALKAMIRPPTVMGKFQSTITGKSTSVADDLAEGMISSMPWRKAGVKYAQNEIYLDIIEEVDAILDRNGTTISSEVTGVVQANSRLSGIPDLTLSFADPNVIDDCSFHPCVRYNRFERDSAVSFVPPDGQFELMRYRVSTQRPVVAPIYCQSQMVIDPHGPGDHGRFTVSVGMKHNSSLITTSKSKTIPMEEVALSIPFPKQVKTANLDVNIGTVTYDEATKIAKWTIGKLSASTGKAPQLTGKIVLQGAKLEEPPPIELNWKVPTASVSGIAIASLQLSNEKYRPYKGVRTITRSGRFHIRSH